MLKSSSNIIKYLVYKCTKKWDKNTQFVLQTLKKKEFYLNIILVCSLLCNLAITLSNDTSHAVSTSASWIQAWVMTVYHWLPHTLHHTFLWEGCLPSVCCLASIPAPLTRGPGNHRLRVGGFNSKFVSKTSIVPWSPTWLIKLWERNRHHNSRLIRGGTDLTEMASNKRLEASRLARAGRYW